MTIQLEVNGQQLSNFTEASVELQLDALSSAFNFMAAEPFVNIASLTIKEGDACRVFIDGDLVLTGTIEVENISHSRTDHTISLTGRCKTADLLDSTLDTVDGLSGEGLTLKALIEQVVKALGLEIKVISEVTLEPFSITEELPLPEVGQNAWEYIEGYAQKRAVLLTNDENANVVITTNSGAKAPGRLQYAKGATDNNIHSASSTRDRTGRFNRYKINSGANPLALNESGESSADTLVDQNSEVFDPDISPTRQLIMVPKVSYTAKSGGNRANWEKNVRKARGDTYSAQLIGHRVAGFSGALWKLNTLYTVIDQKAKRDEIMLCNGLTFSYSRTAGTTTQIEMVNKNAYSIEGRLFFAIT